MEYLWYEVSRGLVLPLWRAQVHPHVTSVVTVQPTMILIAEVSSFVAWSPMHGR